MRIHSTVPLLPPIAAFAIFALLATAAMPLPSFAQAKPPQLTAPRAAKPASAAASAILKTDPDDMPRPGAAACTGPACTPTVAPEPGAAAAVPLAARKPPPRLNAATQKSLGDAQAFAEKPAVQPAVGKGGRIVFTFGDSIPTVVCAPLRVCDIELEPGEAIQGAPHIGDAVRWRVSPAQSFEGEQRVTHLIVKATAAELDTNLIVPTDRRTYYLRLVSSEDRYVSRVAFDYPENDERAWKRLAQQSRAASARGAVGAVAAATPIDDLPAVAMSRLNFNYTVQAKGNPKFRPVRVMDDGARVFITMHEAMAVDEAPVLFIVGADGVEQIVNYRLKGNIFVIDRLADKLALISGAGGSEQRVDIARDTCSRQGWQGWAAFFKGCGTPASTSAAATVD